jgi:hypothetical protein
MDEILIEGKKYVSSKQAAKMTGYAKDYIGQLCREGRVPARLVGRSWYVLESAIQDHRFGSQDVEARPVQPESAMSLTHTWESVRYEASDTEALPSLNRLERSERAFEPMEEEGREAVKLSDLHDSWKAWFSHVAETETNHAEPTEDLVPEEEVETPPVQLSIAEEEVVIPLHVVAEKRSLREILPVEREEERLQSSPIVVQEAAKEEKGPSNRGALSIAFVLGALLALTSVAFAVIGSGFFDEYFMSSGRVSFISGITVVNK